MPFCCEAHQPSKRECTLAVMKLFGGFGGSAFTHLSVHLENIVYFTESYVTEWVRFTPKQPSQIYSVCVMNMSLPMPFSIIAFRSITRGIRKA
ncbi:hypothetical protein NPIL_170221 [Nephila pilipes]|uniref:Uncharacterized protein n=1 Tax=Nephila pilipes TaxID=299642 RepID=A0A8X6QRM0_NEPPI|nr:hypothetical protein NPIL_170221 [Nephila pilipes]